jgi:uncharacterized membrane protein
MLFLMFLTLIPFATSVVAENPRNILAVMTYSFILFGTSTTFSTLRYFVERHQGTNKIKIIRSLVGPVIYGFSIIGSFFSIELSYALLIIPPLFYFLPRNS